MKTLHIVPPAIVNRPHPLIIVALGLIAFDAGCSSGSINIPDPDTSRSSFAIRQAIQTARQHVAAAPRSPVTWGRLGQLCFAHQFLKEAVICLEEARKRDSADGRWSYLLAVMFEERDLAQTAELFKESARRSPRMAVTHVRLGMTLARLGQLKAAAAAFDGAVNLDPDQPAPRLARARFSMSTQNWKSAEVDLKVASRTSAASRAVWLELARCYALSGRDQDAADAMRLADSALPGEPPLNDPWYSAILSLEQSGQSLAERADRQLASGQLAAAEQSLLQLTGDHPELPRSWLNLAMVQAQLGRTADSLMTSSELVRRFPNEPTGYLCRGRLLLLAGDLHAARDVLLQASDLKPDAAEAWHLLGQLAEQQEHVDVAECYYRRAIHVSPAQPGSQVRLAVLLSQKHRRAEAIALLERAATLAPQNPTIVTLLDQWRTAERDEAPASAFSPSNGR